jgi:hypothetical protein
MTAAEIRSDIGRSDRWKSGLASTNQINGNQVRHRPIRAAEIRPNFSESERLESGQLELTYQKQELFTNLFYIPI